MHGRRVHNARNRRQPSRFCAECALDGHLVKNRNGPWWFFTFCTLLAAQAPPGRSTRPLHPGRSNPGG
jgi:hypothetical protein